MDEVSLDDTFTGETEVPGTHDAAELAAVEDVLYKAGLRAGDWDRRCGLWIDRSVGVWIALLRPQWATEILPLFVICVQQVVRMTPFV